VLDPVKSPITCFQWAKSAGAVASLQTLLTGAMLPLRDGQRTVSLVGAGSGATANRVAVTPGTGYLVQATGQAAAGDNAAAAGSLSTYWISDTGVRYGISTEGDGATGDRKTLAALGLTGTPLSVPWSVLSQFAAGPSLSRADALLAQDAPAPVVSAPTSAAPAPVAMRENP
jgi:hypothetical protein